MINFKKIKSAILSSVVAATSVAGSFSVAAPSLNAAAANDNYARLLQHSLYFYDANMCGTEVESKCALSWRGNCHTGDDADGGFHDAGDHVMFGLPQGFTASTLGWSYYEFKDAYNDLGQTEHLKVITDHFCDFFKRSTKLSGDSVSNFCYQKGEGNEDHAYWGPPESQSNSRKQYWTSGGASDIAAEYAAALAINYINFGDAEDLKYAEALYKFSTQHNAVATDGTTGFYSNTSCVDEQAWAAGWLYLATNDGQYKNDCASKQTQYLGWVHGWENVGLGAACVYAHITGDWSKVNGWIGGQCTSNNYYFLDKWGSARLNTSMQFTALVATKNSGADYSAWCKNQMNYILGDNPANTCFVVGFESNSASKPHHRAASGTSTAEDNSPSKYTLVGALVGGPSDAGGTYQDNRADYICNEVAVDYNAGFVGAAAGLYSIYGTGTLDTSIVGVDKVYGGGGSSSSTTTKEPSQGGTTTKPTTKPPTNTTTTPAGGDVTLLPDDMKVGTEEGSDGEINNYAEFSPQGAKSATLYYTVKSNDTESSGAFGTWTGEWEQEDFKVNVKSGKVEVSYDIPSNVGQTVKAMIFWPHGDSVEIDKVVLHKGGSSAGTTKPTTTKPTTTKPTTTKPTTTKPTTKPPTNTTTNTPSSSGETVLLPDDMKVGTEEGDDGEINNYAEFAPKGAKKATLYYSVTSNDTESSGAFGTWTGEWEQEDFKVNVKNGKVEVSYDIPSNVGQTVKAMIFWPHGNSVKIEKVVLSGGSSAGTTTKPTTTKPTTTKPTTTKPTTTQPQPANPGTTTTVTLYGDANCDGRVTIADATAILQHVGNTDKYGLSAQGLANADVSGNGDGVTASDAATIQRIDAGEIKASDLPIR